MGKKQFKCFEKPRLNPQRLRTVADRRFDDAEYLCNSNKNVHANGVMYLGGFVIECLLKAKLLETYPWLQNAGIVEKAPKGQGRIWRLCYTSHDLEEILENMPELRRKIAEEDQRQSQVFRRTPLLGKVIGEWTIYARYSPQNSFIQDAGIFLANIREIKRWLQ